MAQTGELIPNGVGHAATPDAHAKFVSQNDAARFRMSASNSVGQHAFVSEAQRPTAVAPSITNIDGLSNGFSCGSLSQMAQFNSHQTYPSQKQQEMARSSVSSNLKSGAVGGFRPFDHFKGGALPNLDYLASNNIQFQDQVSSHFGAQKMFRKESGQKQNRLRNSMMQSPSRVQPEFINGNFGHDQRILNLDSKSTNPSDTTAHHYR